MSKDGKILMCEPKYDLEKIVDLKNALLEYVKRYGLTQSAREALEQLEGIQVRNQERHR